MFFRISAAAFVASFWFRVRRRPRVRANPASQIQQQIQRSAPSLQGCPIRAAEFVRQCAPHMMGRWAHPEEVCGCLHDHAAAAVEDNDLREALLRGISETGVPTIETEWVPASKQSEIGATFTKIAKPTLQCMFEPRELGSQLETSELSSRRCAPAARAAIISCPMTRNAFVARGRCRSRSSWRRRLP